MIEEAVRQVDAKLIVIDPISGFMTGNSNVQAHVTRCLNPLVRLATRTCAAVVIVRHLRKSGQGRAIHRGMGSIAFSGTARSILAVCNDPASTDPYRHLLAHTKSNSCSSAPSLAYRTVEKGGIIGIDWLGPSDWSPNEIIGDDHAVRTARENAIWILFSLLANGPMTAKEVYTKAFENGVSKRTLDRAKTDMRVVSKRRGSGSGSSWWWQLPETSALTAALRERDLDELCEMLVEGYDDGQDCDSPDSSENGDDVQDDKPDVDSDDDPDSTTAFPSD